ncbi:MAG: hypothetical protein ACLUVC_07175 [Longibaculum sp.]
MKEILQNYINNEWMLCHLYQQAATFATLPQEEKALLNFAKNCEEIHKNLKQIYWEAFGEVYEPHGEKIKMQGDYRDLLNQIQTIELEYFLEYRSHTYHQDNPYFKEAMREYADYKLAHTLDVQAMLIYMNGHD